MLAAAMRGTTPNAVEKALSISGSIPASWLVRKKVLDISTSIPTPMATRRRMRRNPYSSVMISPIIYASGNRMVPASKVREPMVTTFMLMMLLMMSVAINRLVRTSGVSERMVLLFIIFYHTIVFLCAL